MRHTNPFRSGRRKSRTYPELRIDNLPQPPQNKYQQAMSYIDGVVRKTTDTGAMKQIPGLWPTQGSSKMFSPSPILQGLQSHRKGGSFSLKPGQRSTEHRKVMPPREPVQVKMSARATEHSLCKEDNMSRSSSDQELVEAMQGLKLFGALRPGSDQSSVPSCDGAEKKAYDAELLDLARVDAEATRPTASGSVSLDITLQLKPTSGPVAPAEATMDAVVTIDNGNHEHHIHPKQPWSGDKQGTQQSGDELPVLLASSASSTSALAEPTDTEDHASQKNTSQAHPETESAKEPTGEDESFEDIPLDSPTPSGPIPSVESADPDDDFEVVETDSITSNPRESTMSFWNTAKWALTTALNHIEGRPTPERYELHPDSAYLGNKYYPRETQALPVSTRSIPSDKSSTLASSPSSLTSLAPAIKSGSHTGIMQPHVHIGKQAVQTPMRLPEAKYTVLRQGGLVDDDRIEGVVGRDRDLYWVVKGVVVLMVRERSEAEAVVTLVRKTKAREEMQGMGGVVEDMEGGRRNPLRSPSVEDFFADARQYPPIEKLPPNPLDKLPGASQPLNPLDAFPWSEMVIVFRHDTKELFVRKLDGKLYPVVWKVRAIQSRRQKVDDDDGPRVVSELKFTSVEGEIDAEDYVNVELV
ncbi:hypothetical protein PMIN07_006085 [Paraphaeosphaeria minitans]